MKINIKDFRVSPGKKMQLNKWPTLVEPYYKSKKHYKDLLREGVEELSRLQMLQYASNSDAVLLIFQGMDAAGKDGVIRHVMSGINPGGCQVYSFKEPSTKERQHDFLWRTICCLPERGRIGIFNRSYYEEVLIVRVHPEFLVGQGFPKKSGGDNHFWETRFRSIVNLEEHLHHNNTRILKFYLHLSEEEQRKRLLERIEDPDKNWKVNLADIQERKFWQHYQKAYEACIKATSTSFSPWHIIPADDKQNARLIVSQIILETFRGLKMAYPEVTPQHRQELKMIRKELLV